LLKEEKKPFGDTYSNTRRKAFFRDIRIGTGTWAVGFFSGI
jgi:hypothetical protein